MTTLHLTAGGLIARVARLRREREERPEHPADVARTWRLPSCPTLAGTDVLRVHNARARGEVDW